MTETQVETRILAATGATLRYDIRSSPTDGETSEDVLFLIGSPMDAGGFATLASHFTDRTVVTYDPRGVGRSPRTDGSAETTPEEHADDLRRVIEALGARAVDVFASSGGAVNALALVERHGGLVRTLVAHEPPSAQVLPDREAALEVCADIHATYLRDGMGPAMAKFIAVTSREGPFPATWANEPVPSPSDFGLPTEDDGSRDDPLLGQNMRGCTGYRPDFAALRAASTRIVIAAGRESEGEFAARAASEIAATLGTGLAVFPSHHGGFLGGEFGRHGAPEEFAKALRHVLDTDG
ncbi:alpha/beta fold hydrolase [Streptomyces sp. QHH-9511]|uniref:alpha/beta fold hydrolase n=1 Tax=Streptomyces sp. QHH-9511 TaxID=2684468 RepID=UPI00131665BF|nr:alpha/beta hydrolase [Streptomyces sp. QHH-9511]QGZ52694.1 alpha/beta fold hydrolase [Streptomyces sp. QHH-9511]